MAKSEFSLWPVALLGALLRWCISVCPYSGHNTPPMFGDYEAQRHWMELAVNLPLSQIYTNSSDNDLSYWGVDYPPLTVYHSYVMGKFAQVIEPKWVELNTSRGFENYHHKLFMRSTVFIADILIYFPAAWLILKILVSSSQNKEDQALRKLISFFILICNPALILIDNGHFQYNCVSLGLFIFSVGCLLKNMDVLASIFFCLALNYKQMELYHALPIFFYLFGKCMKLPFVKCMCKLLFLGLTVVLTFAILWVPYLESKESCLQVITRLFPLTRGVFEDKVSNFWCSINIFIKVKLLFSEQTLALLSASLTLLSSLPSCCLVFWRPSGKNLLLSLTSVSIAFFLFSYQVHEKSILLFAIPVSLLINQLKVHHIILVLTTCSLSLSPLYAKDGFLLSAFALTMIFSLLAHFVTCEFEELKPSVLLIIVFNWVNNCILMLCMKFAPKPERFPDIYVVAICLFSCAQFFLFYLVSLVLAGQYYAKEHKETLKKKQL